MKIIDAVKNFEWGMAWRATQKFLFTIGCIALGAWFANLSSPLWMLASAVWLGIVWYLFFLAERAWEKQTHRRRITRRLQSYRPRSSEPGDEEMPEPVQRAHSRWTRKIQAQTPKTRRRFVYFDADKCEDVYTTEFVS
jgi:hypothetical protein